MAMNGRNDEIDVEQIHRNRNVVLDSTQDTPWNEGIIAADSDYGEVLYSVMPEDKVGFLTNGHNRK